MSATRPPAPATRPAATARGGIWRPAASPGGLIGLLGLLASLALTAFMLLRVLPDQEAAGIRAVLIVISVVGAATAMMLVYLLYGYFTLVYLLDRQHLTVRWGWSRHTIPLASIEFVAPAQQVLEGPRPGASMPWPGYYLDAFSLMEGISVRTFATQPVHRQVAVCTADCVYALSPERPVRFMEEVVRLRERATAPESASDPRARPPLSVPADGTAPLPAIESPPTHPPRSRRPSSESPVAAGTRLSALFALFHDRLVRALLAVAAALDVSLLGFILWKLPAQPDRIPLHFNALGQVDRIGQPREILLLWSISGGVMLVNVILALSIDRYDSFIARLLLVGPILIGLIAWVAVFNLL